MSDVQFLFAYWPSAVAVDGSSSAKCRSTDHFSVIEPLRVWKSKWDISHVLVGKVHQCSESGCFWPQCWDQIEKKVPANFSANAAGAHKPPVASMKDFIWVSSVPKRLMCPTEYRPLPYKTSGLMIVTSCFGGACILVNTSSGRVSGTWKILIWAP